MERSAPHEWIELPEPFEAGSGSHSRPGGRQSLHHTPVAVISYKLLLT